MSTISSTPLPHLTFQVDTFDAQEIREDIQALAQIFLNHKEEIEQGKWQDPTSQSLFKWGDAFFDSKGKEELQDPERFLKSMERRLNELFFKILVNPLNTNLHLQVPLIDGRWMWEQSMYDHYLAVARIVKNLPIDAPVKSPFDGKPMKGAVHVLAHEVLNWALEMIEVVNQAPQPEEPPTEAYAEGALAFRSEKSEATIAKLYYINYNLAIQNFKSELLAAESRQRQEASLKAKQQEHQQSETGLSEARSTLASASQYLTEQEELWPRRLAETEEKHNQAYGTYTEITTDLGTGNQSLSTKVDQLSDKVSSDKKRINQLESQLTRQEQEITDIQNRRRHKNKKKFKII